MVVRLPARFLVTLTFSMMKSARIIRPLILLICLLLNGSVVLAEAESPSFESDILPIFYRHCFSCHSEKQAQPKGELRLDSARGIRDGDVIVPGKPDASEMLKRVSLPSTDEDVMPPLKGGAQPLSDAERAMLREWIAGGAKTGTWVKFEHRDAPASTSGETYSRTDGSRLAAQLDDRVQRHHAAMSTKLNAAASDETFLRRVFLDVVGRIPSLGESTRFLGSKDADKRAKLIDELLDSEGYVSHMFNWKADLLRVNTRGLAAGQPGWLYDDWVKDSIRSRMPWDEFVLQLVTASGYLWENGAVGFYVRDLGMPLDHMSNMTRIFLGTRIECAQCHDHPLEPITQKDFYQMVAFTFGVSNLGNPGGYSNDNVKQWPEIKARLNAMPKDEALSQGVSRTISNLKRLTTDTDKQLKFPDTYAYDAEARKKPVEPRTLFGDEATVSEGGRRKAFAEWMTSPRNPRFAKNIANRLWKRVMGTGLIEPVDSLSSLPNPQHTELMDFLAQTMVGLRFDERAFLAVLLNTRLYQSEAERDKPEPGVASELRGPQLRRLSAEQIWDSHLVLLAKDIDERRYTFNHEGSAMNPERLLKLSAMSADEIIARARDEMAYRIRQREYSLRLVEQHQERSAAQARGDEQEVKRLQAAHAKENKDFYSPELMAMEMGSGSVAKETDPRWRSLPQYFVRASETPLPLPLGHFLRQFGQSDRREIDAFNRDPNTTHSLALMNGELTSQLLADDSFLRRQIAASSEQKTQVIYRGILVRSPTAEEIAEIAKLTKGSPTPEQDIIWALLNSPEFLFNQ